MNPNSTFMRTLRTGASRARRQAARLYKMGNAEAAFLSYPEPAKFGDDLANVLEHRPAAALAVVNARVAAYQYLAHLGNIVREFKIDFVIDAGAHSGQFASSLFGYGEFKGEIHSFEPVRKYYDVMAGHVSYWKGWKAYNAALGDVPGPSRIFVGGGHGGTSSLLPQSDNLKNFVADCLLGEPEDIVVHRVDEMFGSVISDPAHRVMLKLDVQGFEERVLKSSGKHISDFKLLQVELSAIPFYTGQMSLSDLCSMLERLGYALIYTANNFGIKKSVFLDYDFVFCQRTELEAMRP